MSKFYTSVLIIFFFHFSNAQVSGTIRNEETKEPLSGATIKVDKVKGGFSDASGRFEIPNLSIGEHDLNISFIGYKNEKQHIEIKEGEKLKLDILLKPSAFQMSEVFAVRQYKKNSAKETVSTEVVSKKQIQNTQANELNDVLNRVSGVLVQDGSISMRGGSSYSYGVGTRTAVTSDGLSLASADRGEVQSKMVTLSNIKQVEVVKGASSVVYGSNALNGVVNIVTAWPTESEPKTEIETNVGVYDNPSDLRRKWWGDVPPFFGSVNVNHQRRIGNLQFVCGGNIYYDKNYLQGNNGFRFSPYLKTRYIFQKVSGLSMGVNAQAFVERNELFFISKDLDSLALVPATFSGDKHQKFLIDPHLAYGNDKGHNFKLNMRYMVIWRRGNGADIDAVGHSLAVDEQYQYRFKKDLLIVTAGLPFNVGISKSNLYPGNHVNFGAAVYTQLEFNYKILSLQGGIRYEVSGVDTQIISTRPIFRAGLNIQAAKATFIRASWGQGYRVPTIAEKYIAEPFISTVLIIPNDTLKAETSWSFEVGIKQGFQIRNWKAFIDASFFWQEYKNYIEYVVSVWPNKYPNGNQIFPDSLEFPFKGSGQIIGAKPVNLENARIAGYEIGLQTMGKIGPVGLQISGGYSYNYPSRKDKNNPYKTADFIRDVFKYNGQRVAADDTARVLAYRIRHLFRTDLELTYWKCYVGATFNYGSIPEVVPGFYKAIANVIFHDITAVDKYINAHIKGDFFMDLRAGIKINEHFSMGFIVKNLTNHFYSLRPGKPEPLRNYTLQFRYNF